MEELLIIGFLSSFLFYFIKTKNKVLSPDIVLILFYITILPTIIGIIVITKGDAEEFMSFGIGNFISEKTKKTVYYEYFISWIATFLIFGFYYKKIKLTKNIEIECKYKSIILILGAVPLLFDLLMMPEYPLIKLIKEGIESGAISRGYVINYQIQNGIPLVNLIIRAAPTITLIWLFKNWLTDKKDIYFPLYSVFYIIAYGMTLAKSFFIIPVLLIFWQYTVIRSNNIKNSLLFIVIILTFLICSFYLISDDIKGALESLILRLFIVQSEGAYLIREEYQNFNINALTYGFPFSKYFDYFQNSFDPSIEVVKMHFPDIDGWVNINSYYIGQGAVMVGEWISIIGPVILFLNIYLINTIYKYYNNISKINYIYFIVAGYFIITIPLNTNFSLLLYFKPVFGALLLSIYYFISIKIFVRKK
jgi:hypothetical protein